MGKCWRILQNIKAASFFSPSPQPSPGQVTAPLEMRIFWVRPLWTGPGLPLSIASVLERQEPWSHSVERGKPGFLCPHTLASVIWQWQYLSSQHICFVLLYKLSLHWGLYSGFTGKSFKTTDLWPKERVNKPQTWKVGRNHQWNISLEEETWATLDVSLHLDVLIHTLRELNIMIPALAFYSSWVFLTLPEYSPWNSQTDDLHKYLYVTWCRPSQSHLHQQKMSWTFQEAVILQSSGGNTQEGINPSSHPSIHSVIPSL